MPPTTATPPIRYTAYPPFFLLSVAHSPHVPGVPPLSPMESTKDVRSVGNGRRRKE